MKNINSNSNKPLSTCEESIKKELGDFYAKADVHWESYSQISLAWVHLKRAVRLYLADKPHVFSLLYGLVPKYRGIVVSKKTEVVIEGYPRSGNTYAVAAFHYAQQRDVIIARHQHSVAQVLFAVRYGLPCIVMIRKPKDAILSYLIREPSITLYEAIGLYTDYYNALSSHKHSFVIAKFEDVIIDFNAIIRQVNAKYDCQFRHYSPNKQSEMEIVSRIAYMEKIESGSSDIRCTHVAMPDNARSELKQWIDLMTTEYSFEEAEKAYNRFIG